MGFAKDAIQVAARDYEGIIWAVANLADMPLSDHTCNIILNILSPANASEFTRVLSNNGLLIKVVPGKSYLQELRYALYGQTQSRTDTERKLSAHMPDNFMLADVHNINYQVTVKKDALDSLVSMPPLSWGSSEAHKQKVLSLDQLEITVDLNILAGKKQ
ncbi:hypothetical protein J2S00_002481 [Caldalkalibacillus uzonensis]|uniref:Uncharacterized protein n=1 Tax=Caldalkalibacillus uzonensis TaxID=353224 RepID=A0ABU0CTC9_9BACI|nr:23S rRNA (guanine-N1)-methyltransferase [Caldalkalibacillus uzonensis]MDQ0339688.1 hypothetical protein [Caldalkalibacillus uzonensis]